MAGPLASVGPSVVEQAVAGARPWWLVVAATGAGWLVVGPLLNHAIFRWIGWRVVLPLLLGRVPEQRELGRPRASCPRCGDPADILGLPVLPFAAAAGRCGSCGAGRYRWTAAVEAATGLAFGAAAATWGLSWTLLPVLVLIAGAVAMSAVDLWVMRIPTRFVRATGLGIAVTVGLAVAADTAIPLPSLGGALAGAAVFGGLLGLVYLLSPRMLGFGDVRLGVVAGGVLGWIGWSAVDPVGSVTHVLSALLLASLVGTVWGTVLLVVRGRNAPFPFGPALALGTVASVVLAARGR